MKKREMYGVSSGNYWEINEITVKISKCDILSNNKNLTKRGKKKKLNSKLERHMAGHHAFSHFIYIYIYWYWLDTQYS